jgi:hypothetical protein
MPYIPPPKEGLKAFPEAQRVKPKSQRQRWEDAEYIYEWDYQHGRVEKWTKRGQHLGDFDPESGAQVSPARSERTIRL